MKPTKADREAALELYENVPMEEEEYAAVIDATADVISRPMAPARERARRERCIAQKWRKHYRTHTFTCPGCNAASEAMDKEKP